MTSKTSRAFWISAYLSILTVVPTQAQQQPAAQNRESPQRTTATYGDWTVRCEIKTTSPEKACEMVQSTQAQGQGHANPITQIAIGRPIKTAPVKAIIQVPINVWLPAGVRLLSDDKDPGIAAVYSRCVPAGCLAEIDLKDETIKKLRALTGSGKLQLKDAAQQDVAIPVSFKGFSQAYEAMLKE